MSLFIGWTSALGASLHGSPASVPGKTPQLQPESKPNPAAFNELRSLTDLALLATKMKDQAIGRSMVSLVVLECHLCPGPRPLDPAPPKDAYFHIQIAPHHRRFLRFPFEEWLINTWSSSSSCPWLPALL